MASTSSGLDAPDLGAIFGYYRWGQFLRTSGQRVAAADSRTRCAMVGFPGPLTLPWEVVEAGRIPSQNETEAKVNPGGVLIAIDSVGGLQEHGWDGESFCEKATLIKQENWSVFTISCRDVLWQERP
ncbi:hypothetical protein ZHAS_00013201 [Anopheles sinensis]|uniref:Uncharacterized protein n=1 Tax=Anopheles sinensis TaxID=74873 RepID=A0A084W4W2_ANOSI|nr:hypothetical protein ZHAS_00013201 [Anopheles sinensis]